MADDNIPNEIAASPDGAPVPQQEAPRGRGGPGRAHASTSVLSVVELGVVGDLDALALPAACPRTRPR